MRSGVLRPFPFVHTLKDLIRSSRRGLKLPARKLKEGMGIHPASAMLGGLSREVRLHFSSPLRYQFFTEVWRVAAQKIQQLAKGHVRTQVYANLGSPL